MSWLADHPSKKKETVERVMSQDQHTCAGVSSLRSNTRLPMTEPPKSKYTFSLCLRYFACYCLLFHVFHCLYFYQSVFLGYHIQTFWYFLIDNWVCPFWFWSLYFPLTPPLRFSTAIYSKRKDLAMT